MAHPRHLALPHRPRLLGQGQGSFLVNLILISVECSVWAASAERHLIAILITLTVTPPGGLNRFNIA